MRSVTGLPFKANAIAPGRAHLVDAAALWTPRTGAGQTQENKIKQNPAHAGQARAGPNDLRFTLPPPRPT